MRGNKLITGYLTFRLHLWFGNISDIPKYVLSFGIMPLSIEFPYISYFPSTCSASLKIRLLVHCPVYTSCYYILIPFQVGITKMKSLLNPIARISHCSVLGLCLDYYYFFFFFFKLSLPSLGLEVYNICGWISLILSKKIFFYLNCYSACSCLYILAVFV